MNNRLDIRGRFDLDSQCSNLRGYEHDTANQTIRFQSAQLGLNRFNPRERVVPSKAGNRSRHGVTALAGVLFPVFVIQARPERRMNLRVQCRNTSSACQPAAFSHRSFTRFRRWEVAGNSRQAVYGQALIVCYPPHTSRLVSYPGDFRVMRLYGNRTRLVGQTLPSNSLGYESVMRIREQSISVLITVNS